MAGWEGTVPDQFSVLLVLLDVSPLLILYRQDLLLCHNHVTKVLPFLHWEPHQPILLLRMYLYWFFHNGLYQYAPDE